MTTIITEPEQTRFVVGEHVRTRGVVSRFAGEVVAVFRKRSGAVRYIVEDERGVLLMFSALHLEPNALSTDVNDVAKE